MREVLFKAKRLDNGDWVEGIPIRILNEKDEEVLGFFHDLPLSIYVYKLEYNSCDYEYKADYNNWFYEIDPNTLSQFTGLLDKNGNKIFENDILQREDGATYWCFYNSSKGLFNLYAYDEDPFDTWERWEVSINDFLRGGLEIVGNIHE